MMGNDEPPIEIIIKEMSQRSELNLKATEPDSAEPASDEQLIEAPPKIEIKPAPNRESKIKRKATGFVKDPPEDGRKCCVLM